MTNRVIWTVSAGHVIPDAFAEAVAKRFPTAYTASTVDNGELFMFGHNLKTTAADLHALREAAGKDKNVVFVAFQYEGELAEEDKQPFSVLVDPDKNTFIFGYAEGDFSGFVKEDSSFTPEYHAVQEYLIPKIEGVAEAHSAIEGMPETIRAILDSLEKDKKDINAKMFGGTRGNLVLQGIVNEGEDVVLFHNKNDLFLKETWGWTTDNCGYGKPAAAAAPAKPAGKFAKQSASAATATAADKPTSVDEMVWMKAGPLVQTNQDIKKFHEEIFNLKPGETPPGMDMKAMLNKSKFQVPKDRLEEIKKMTIGSKFVLVTATDPASGADTTKAGGSGLPIPAMSPKSKDDVHKKAFKTGSLGDSLLDHSSQKMESLDQIKALKEQYADWFRQMEKHDPRFTEAAKSAVFWPYAQFEDIAFVDAKAIAILCWNLACRAALAEAKVVELEGVKRDKGDTSTKPATAAANAGKPTITAPAGGKFAKQAAKAG